MGTLLQSLRRAAGSQSQIHPVAADGAPKFPPFLQPIVRTQAPVDSPVQTTPALEDPDFDLMFSSHVAPVVGSLRSGAEVNEGSSGGRPDLSPHSYI
jgi:hypothetical protein